MGCSNDSPAATVRIAPASCSRRTALLGLNDAAVDLSFGLDGAFVLLLGLGSVPAREPALAP